MRNFLREYGLIALLIVIAMAGYLVYYQGTGDVLYTSLNVVGDRLLTMVTGGDNASDLIDQFKARVFGREDDALLPEPTRAEAAPAVASDALAEAEAALPTSPSTVTPAPVAPPDPPALASASSEDGAMILAEQIRLAFPNDPGLREKLSEHVHMIAEDGFRVIIDNEVKELMSEAERTRLLTAIRKVEQKKRVQWAESLSRAVRERVEVGRPNADMRPAEPRTEREPPALRADAAQRIALAQVQKSILAFRETTREKALASLAALRHLAERRHLPPTEHDAMRRAVQSAMDEALAHVDEASGALARHAGRETFETEMEAYRLRLDAYLESYEARLESMLDSLGSAEEEQVDVRPRTPYAAVYARSSASRENAPPSRDA